MAQLVGTDEIESMRIELAEIGRSLRSSFRRHTASFRSTSTQNYAEEVEADAAANEGYNLQWAEIERLPTFDRIRSSLFSEFGDGGTDDGTGKRVVDVTKLGALERQMFIEKLIKHIEHDNLRLLQKVRRRIDKVGVKLATVEVRYQNLCIEADCKVVHGKPLPTLWNAFKGIVFGLLPWSSSTSETKINILNDVNGIVKPGRLTLLLGPPGCGKTSLLLALSGNLSQSLKTTGIVSYNGYEMREFVPRKTSAYISQNDLHIPEMTVRETLDFSALCLGVGSRPDIIAEVSRREKQAGIFPDPDTDIYMKRCHDYTTLQYITSRHRETSANEVRAPSDATSIKGKKRTLHTDYILKILGLDNCADTIVGDAMRRGISGGQKKRLTTGEMIVGPAKALFMDEITNGLDSSTAYQIVACLQQLVHITDATVLVSLLQPAPETFDLFDDIILMAEGKIMFHGPRDKILDFFEECGFRCPDRKGIADFLQEVISRKDQGQYWFNKELPYRCISANMFRKKFKESSVGKGLDEELLKPFDRSESHKRAISFSSYTIPKWELFRACFSRELLLMRRNSFVYVFKTIQLVFIAFIMMTTFIRTRMRVDLVHSSYFMNALFYAIIILVVDGFPELSMTVMRLAVFYKQKELYFYPAWAYAIPAALLKIPLSLVQSLSWTCLTYYVVGYSPEAFRFFRHFILLFGLHLSSISLFRFVASLIQTVVLATTAGSFSIILVSIFGGFLIPPSSMPDWLKWVFWISPISYAEIGLSTNEFLAPRWQKVSAGNTTIGILALKTRGLDYDGYFFWISLGALFGFVILFNIGFVLALTFLRAPGRSQAIISHEKLSQLKKQENSSQANHMDDKDTELPQIDKGRMVLPFQPLTITFHNVQYYIETPPAMKERGFTEKRLQLLCDITGLFRPGILTALMGVSGAGKTTLLDVLSGRKTSGIIQGEIRIGGYPKVHETFARVSGYCEQTDIHSPQITVEESVIFSAWLRLPSQIDPKTKAKFVNEVIETIELDGLKDSLVGIPGVSGLSVEQRKRLTIAVEVVANPSIIFLDEPTTGLDARAAAIVMRAVKNVVDTGRTVVCTIHQPSIDIFEAFNELVLLKSGGRMIYAGPVGHHSHKIIEYFESIPGVPRITKNYNPATWMLEVTSQSSEAELAVDFAHLYRESAMYQSNIELVKHSSQPPPGSSDLHFSTRFSQDGWGQFKSCLWKQHFSYWRSPSYNLMRLFHTIATSLISGLLFWNKGKDIKNSQDVFSVFGIFFAGILFLGINNSSNVLPYVSTERTVLYRERYAGMYSSWAYSLAQVTVEIPYSFIQSLIYFIITYPMIGFHWSVYKVFWYLYAMFCSLLYFNYLGMMLVSLTPNFQIAAIISSAFYTIMSLFSGFIIPQPQVPKWWIWLFYLCPTSWSINGLVTSQYGDVNKGIDAFGVTKPVAAFLEDYFGFRHDHLALVGVMLLVFPTLFASIFAFLIGKLNFQRR